MSNKLIIYQADNGAIELKGDIENETAWASQKEMAEIFGVTTQNITIHLKQIFKDNELEEKATCKESLQVQKEGNRSVKRKIKEYNLDVMITVSSSGAYTGFINFFNHPIFASDCTTIQTNEEEVSTIFLYRLLKSMQHNFYKLQQGGAQSHVYGKDFGEIKIPLPPLAIQEEIVAEIKGYQKIIDGARQVVDNYKPTIKINPDWEMVTLEQLLSDKKYSIKAGPFGSSIKKEFYVKSGYKVYGQEQVIKDDFNYGDYYINEEKYQELKNCRIQSDDILISLVGTIGKVAIVPSEFEKGIINPRLIKITLDVEKMTPLFFQYYFKSHLILSQIKQSAGGGTMPVLNGRILKALRFLLPPLSTQQEIVTQIQAEQEMVSANKKLIEIFEQKIKDKISEVWGES